MKFRRAGIITIIVILILLMYATFTLVKLRSRIETAQAEQDVLSQQVTEMQVENDAIQYAIDHKDEDATKADIAQDSLGLVDPDSKIYYDSEG